jgi:EAL domain-containing protein (putative c-di-GMP-specific phosphodiesterase class I)
VLLGEVREGQLVGRVGGEEFALVLPGADGAEAHAAADRCRAALCRLRVHGTAISSSAGVASFPEDDPSGTRLFELADGSLYWAKRAGRAQTKRYDPREVVLLSNADQRAQVLAVIEDPDALMPVFQPIVELATGRIAGFEALTRFTVGEPPRPPDLWFAQARRSGLGPALEARALAASLGVPDRPAGTFLSLNVSPGALMSAEVAAVLPDDLDGIVIELTEDEVFSSDVALDAQLAALRARGARIAIDDAGAGYAGLQQVIRVKPEILKLDRSLISGVYEDASKIALLDALTAFASSTGAAVCGEGIEQIEELRTLAGADATYAQGYALARPGPAWPAIAQELAAETSAVASRGMRLGVAATSLDAPLSMGAMSERLARVRSTRELEAMSPLMERLMHADGTAISRVLDAERCVQTLFDFTGTDARFAYADYPTTEHVVCEQAVGQVIAGDPASDPAELALLASHGFATVLMAPIVFRGDTVGLLEFYRRVARPWTSAEIDRARLLAHSLGAAVQAERAGGELPWSPATFGAT